MEFTDNITLQHSLRTNDLPFDRTTAFDLRPGKEVLAQIANAFGLKDLRKLRFSGELSPLAKKDWRMHATIGATIEQACVLSGDPVTTRIDEKFKREYISDFPEPGSEAEVEMTVSELAVPLGKEIDVVEAMLEALAINVPDYPRRDDLVGEPLNQSFAAPGVSPMTDDDAKPFAGLKGLRDALRSDDQDTDK